MGDLIGVVFNPNSKKNRRDPSRFARLTRIVDEVGSVHRTRHVDAIADVVHQLLDDEVPYWVADGGDGAFHWLVNVAHQVIAQRGRGESLPAILPTKSGTIDFLAKKVGLQGDAESLLQEVVDHLCGGSALESVAVDSLMIEGVFAAASERPGQRFVRVGFASAFAGVGQRFFDKFYANGNLGGVGVVDTVARILGSAVTRTFPLRHVPLPTHMRSYGDSVFEPAHAVVTVDGAELESREFRAINAGSIDINLAGIFRLFPLAEERGVMHLIWGNPQIAGIVRALPRMAAGASLEESGLRETSAHEMTIEMLSGTLDPVIDGELFYGLKSVQVSLGPAVSILTTRPKV